MWAWGGRAPAVRNAAGCFFWKGWRLGPLPPLQLLTKVASLQPPLPLYSSLVRPHLRTLVGVVEGSLGPAAKFVPSATHVLLVALLLAVLVTAGSGGEGKSAAKAPSRRR